MMDTMIKLFVLNSIFPINLSFPPIKSLASILSEVTIHHSRAHFFILSVNAG